MTVTLFLMSLVILGLAVRQMSFIILFGSIFQSLRDWIAEKYYHSAEYSFNKRFWLKINQLFTCHLCMTAQVALWTTMFIIIFLTIVKSHFLINVLEFKVNLFPEVIINIGFIFIFAMATAALAMGFWNLIEYFPKKLAMQKEFLRKYLEFEMEKNEIQSEWQEQREVLRRELENEIEVLFRSGVERKVMDIVILKKEEITLLFTISNFKQLIEKLSKHCDSIGCSKAKKDCRAEVSRKYIQTWCLENGILSLRYKSRMQKVADETMRKYYTEYKNEEIRPIGQLYDFLVSSMAKANLVRFVEPAKLIEEN